MLNRAFLKPVKHVKLYEDKVLRLCETHEQCKPRRTIRPPVPGKCPTSVQLSLAKSYSKHFYIVKALLVLIDNRIFSDAFAAAHRDHSRKK